MRTKVHKCLNFNDLRRKKFVRHMTALHVLLRFALLKREFYRMVQVEL
jgi:hypothetical protein